MPSDLILKLKLRTGLFRNKFDNRLFWNHRYEEDANKGSGIGSRGQVLEYKRGLLQNIAEEVKLGSILDIGCGDMAVGSVLPSGGYTGIDISDVIIERNKRSYSDRAFLAGNLLEMDVHSADMTIALDVLIHIPSLETYKAMVRSIIMLANKIVILSGYERKPQRKSPITFYHEPLSRTIATASNFSFSQIGSYNQVVIYRINK